MSTESQHTAEETRRAPWPPPESNLPPVWILEQLDRGEQGGYAAWQASQRGERPRQRGLFDENNEEPSPSARGRRSPARVRGVGRGDGGCNSQPFWG